MWGGEWGRGSKLSKDVVSALDWLLPDLRTLEHKSHNGLIPPQGKEVVPLLHVPVSVFYFWLPLLSVPHPPREGGCNLLIKGAPRH